MAQLSPYLESKCLKITRSFINCDNFIVFKNKVEEADAPDYYSIIKEPMCLNEVIKRLKKHRYSTLKDYVYDMSLIWNNCKKYNVGNVYFNDLACFAEYRFNRKINKLPKTGEEEFLKKLEKYTKQISSYTQCLQQELDHIPANYDPEPR